MTLRNVKSETSSTCGSVDSATVLVEAVVALLRFVMQLRMNVPAGPTGCLSEEDDMIKCSVFIEGILRFGKCSVRVGYCVSLLVIAMKCGDEILERKRGANEDVAIKCGV